MLKHVKQVVRPQELTTLECLGYSSWLFNYIFDDGHYRVMNTYLLTNFPHLFAIF